MSYSCRATLASCPPTDSPPPPCLPSRPLQVLALRDEHIRVLQDEQQVFDLGQHYLQASSQKLLPAASGAVGGGANALMLTSGAPGSALMAGGSMGVLTTRWVGWVRTRLPAGMMGREGGAAALGAHACLLPGRGGARLRTHALLGWVPPSLLCAPPSSHASRRLCAPRPTPARAARSRR